MRSLLSFVTPLIFFNFSTPVHCENNIKNKTLEQIKQSALADDYAYLLAESLTTEFGARQSGSKAELAAINWLENKLSEIGFTQVVKQPVQVRNWRRHHASAEVILPYQHQLVTTSLGGSVPTPTEGISAELVKFSSVEHLRSATADDIKNKIVYISKKIAVDKDGSDYLTALESRLAGASIAAQLGAKAFIMRSLATDNSRIAHTGAVEYRKGINKIPAAAISNVDADLLDRLFSRNLPITLKLTLNNTENQWNTSYNLIADLPGSEKPNEVILLLAHMDSWDLGSGALDNAAGVAIMLAAIRQLTELEQPLKRTIRLVLLTNTQFNQAGMQTYLKQHKETLSNVVVAAESDLGAGLIWRLDTNIETEQLKAADYIHTLVSDLNIERGHNSSAGNTNSKQLIKYNVPTFNWLQDGTQYFKYLHSSNDTFDKIKLESLQQNVAVYSLFTYVVANSDIQFKIVEEN